MLYRRLITQDMGPGLSMLWWICACEHYVKIRKLLRRSVSEPYFGCIAWHACCREMKFARQFARTR